jgi:hypothetical protein
MKINLERPLAVIPVETICDACKGSQENFMEFPRLLILVPLLCPNDSKCTLEKLLARMFEPMPCILKCNFCETHGPHVKKFQHPEIESNQLVFVFERFNFVKNEPLKNATPVHLPESITFQSKEFYCNCAIIHDGPNLSSGHYRNVCSGKSCFYLYDDDKVSIWNNALPLNAYMVLYSTRTP